MGGQYQTLYLNDKASAKGGDDNDDGDDDGDDDGGGHEDCEGGSAGRTSSDADSGDGNGDDCGVGPRDDIVRKDGRVSKNGAVSKDRSMACKRGKMENGEIIKMEDGEISQLLQQAGLRFPASEMIHALSGLGSPDRTRRG
ncbi:unnamed protein product, partial [Sphacelaria rigidula]